MRSPTARQLRSHDMTDFNGSMVAFGCAGQLPALAGTLLASLQVLHLGSNDINNTLDEGWGSGSSWPQMQRLSLQDNLFYGTLPSTWATEGYWSQLTLLNVSNNHLQGEVPGTSASLAHCRCVPSLMMLLSRYYSKVHIWQDIIWPIIGALELKDCFMAKCSACLQGVLAMLSFLTHAVCINPLKSPTDLQTFQHCLHRPSHQTFVQRLMATAQPSLVSSWQYSNQAILSVGSCPPASLHTSPLGYTSQGLSKRVSPLWARIAPVTMRLTSTLTGMEIMTGTICHQRR